MGVVGMINKIIKISLVLIVGAVLLVLVPMAVTLLPIGDSAQVMINMIFGMIVGAVGVYVIIFIIED